MRPTESAYWVLAGSSDTVVMLYIEVSSLLVQLRRKASPCRHTACPLPASAALVARAAFGLPARCRWWSCRSCRRPQRMLVRGRPSKPSSGPRRRVLAEPSRDDAPMAPLSGAPGRCSRNGSRAGRAASPTQRATSASHQAASMRARTCGYSSSKCASRAARSSPVEVVPFAAASKRGFCQTKAGRRTVWLRIGSPSSVGCARALPRFSGVSSSRRKVVCGP
jgi:hypothetical protein